jgi:hypothetical protein
MPSGSSRREARHTREALTCDGRKPSAEQRDESMNDGAPKALDIPQFEDAHASHPRLIRAANRIGRLLPGSRKLSADALWSAARAGSLADCEPTPEAKEALEVLVDSLSTNVRMNLVGWYSARDDTTRLARTHLRIHRALRENPAISEMPLPPAIFIIGWARTGSTFLHNLLACDPAHRTIPYWESFDPVAPEPGKPDRRIEKLDEMLKLLGRIEPRYHAIHPMAAESPEECVALFMNEFRSLQLDFQYRVPDYAKWLLAEDANVAYDLHRGQLELIQFHRPGGDRMVLKDPTHLVHLATIIDRFPNAKFVFTHRDPATAISSVSSLIAYTRALFSDDVDPRSIGPEIMDGYWPTALEKSRNLRAALPDRMAVDVRYPDLTRDPMGTIESIYRGLGIEFSTPARTSISRFLGNRPDSGRHIHALEGFGLTKDEVRDRFAAYCEELDI